MQRKLDPPNSRAGLDAPQDVRDERDTSTAEIDLRPCRHRREFQPLMRTPSTARRRSVSTAAPTAGGIENMSRW